MRLTAPSREYADVDELIEAYHRNGWTDGLPVVPPTPEKVRHFLEVVGLEPDAVIGTMPSRELEVRAQEVATNSVMAGCLPEYMPVVVASVKALLHPTHIAHSTTATLAGPSQLVLVNGPIRTELEIACEQGCFGPGFRANASIGRALRLVIRNATKAIPGGLDRAAFSTPGRYSFCFGENEEATDWEPLHVQRGFRAEQSTVTVHSALMPLIVNPESYDPVEICAAIVEMSFADMGLWQHQMGRPADVMIVVGAEHQRMFTGAGWDKTRISNELFAQFVARGGPRGHENDLRLAGPDNILVVAAGGPAVDWTVVLPPHLGLAITEPIVRAS